MDTLIQDLRYAVRMLLKKPAFTALAVLTLALGIGMTSAMFSFVDAVLLKPLDYKDAESLVEIWERYPKGGTSNPSPPTYLEWKQLNTVFSHVSIYGNTVGLNLSDASGSEQIQARYVSADYFDMLGVRPVVGRMFQPGEDQVGNEQFVVLSNRMWRAKFGADPQIVGRSITLSQKPYTVTGVLPPDGIFERAANDIYIPQTIRQDQMRRNTQFFRAWARLKPGVTVSQADAEMKRLSASLEQQWGPERKGFSTVVEPLRNSLVRQDVRTGLLILMGAVFFILLIASVNVANLLLVRGASRRREVLIRAAIGASRKRLVRQLLVESLMLSSVAAFLGLWLSYVLLNTFTAMAPAGTIPVEAAIGLDWRVLLFTVAVAGLTGTLCGLAPAWQSARTDISGTLQEHSLAVSSRFGRMQSRLLLISEIALTFVLLVGASLMVRSFVRLLGVDAGIDADSLLTFKIAPAPSKYTNASAVAAFQEEMLTRIRALPGVRAASTTDALPMRDGGVNNDFRIPGRTAGDSDRGNARIGAVDPEYFSAMGSRLMRGRFLSALDTAAGPAVAVVNASLATKFWPNSDPVGHQVSISGVNMYTIVGVISDIKQSGLSGQVRNEIYVPLAQFENKNFGFFVRSLNFVIRTSGDPMQLAGTIQGIARSIDRDQPIYAIKTMDEVISDSLAQPRFRTVLFGIFGSLALILSAVGIYSVMSYSSAQRTKEIGIRMSLGARPSDIFAEVVAQGMLFALIGIGIGCAGALVLTRLIASLLFEITASDPTTFVITALLLTAVAFIACWQPARRAMKTDPLLAIRE